MKNNCPSPARLILDRDALVSNWKTLDRMGGAATTGAAVKADGYGLGAADIVSILYDAGCRDFYVAHWQEAAPLLPFLQDASLSVLNGLMPQDMTNPDLHHPCVKPVLNSMAQVEKWIGAGAGRCDVMVDTGMNRLGLPMNEIDNVMLEQLDIDVCMSHLASADEDIPQNTAQLDNFSIARSAIKARRYSLANSAGIALGEDYHFDLTRPGLALYGGIARAELKTDIRPVVSLEAIVLQVRDLKAGDQVGYNAKFTADRTMRIATCALGYADGYLRAFAGNGEMLLDGQRLPVLGRISMDLIAVDISNIEALQEGDMVKCSYDLQKSAAATGLSQYELLTNLGGRFDRVWR
ncbi:alanine racemase [Sphingorhabdus sp. Alg239-R122]|uniref:alanine racemase n=1 Tax=Sphingorhabdus sp. Alg239-R122 TaxID=2305989 RepID=UPI0013DB0D3D|nr:alanine racemase [Sphingorhabdus sp. Alg239-R122]